MRYFEYLESIQDDEELGIEGYDYLNIVTEEEILDSIFVDDLRRKNDKWNDDKLIKAWAQEEWAVEVSEKEYKKFLKDKR